MGWEEGAAADDVMVATAEAASSVGEPNLPVILPPSLPPSSPDIGASNYLSCPLARPCVFHPLPDAILEREKVWSVAALKPDSPLVGVASASRLVAGDCVLLAGMCRVLLASHEAR